MYTGVDVRTPLRSQESFGAAIAAHACRLYARLVTTPAVAELLPGRSSGGLAMERFASNRLRSLAELQAVLLALQRQYDGGPTAPTRRSSVPDAATPSFWADERREEYGNAELPRLPRVVCDAFLNARRRAAAAPPAKIPEPVQPAWDVAAEGESSITLNGDAGSRRTVAETATPEAAATSSSNDGEAADAEAEAPAPLVGSPQLSVFSPLEPTLGTHTPGQGAGRLPQPRSWFEKGGAMLDSFRQYSSPNVGTSSNTTPSSTPHAQNVAEVQGWLHLLVWARYLFVLLLRELSGAQGGIAWCACYWSWAEDHPREAAFHQSFYPSFWRGAYRHGLGARLASVSLAAPKHMQTLRSLFALIVSCVGSIYHTLEQLNAAISVLQKRCERCTAAAAANYAATAGTRRPADGFGGGSGEAPTSPGLRGGLGTTTDCDQEPPTPRMLVEELRVALLTSIASVMALLNPLRWIMASPKERERMHYDKHTFSLLHEVANSSTMFSSGADLGEAMRVERIMEVLGLAGGSGDAPSVMMREASLEDGLHALLFCTDNAVHFVRRLNTAVQRTHRPPSSRHWRGAVVSSCILVPMAWWLFSTSPLQMLRWGRRVYSTATQVLQNYVLQPARQLWDSVFFVRPGVQDRRRAFDRDAESLANIITDYYEDHYPNANDARLQEVRAQTLQCLRAGIASEDGLGLVEEHYRRAVRHPAWSAVFGDLSRILLIQMSYQALEVSRVTKGIDEVLEGNDLNFKVMALVPLFMSGSMVALWLTLRWRATYKPVQRRMKFYWRAIYRVVSLSEDARMMEDRRPAAAAADMLLGLPPTSMADAGGLGMAGESSMMLPAMEMRGRNPSPDAAPVPHSRRRAVAAAAPSPHGATAELTADRSHYPTTMEGAGPSATWEHDSAHTLAHAMGAIHSTRGLSSYEQGMILLLVHLMRTTANDHLRSYHFFHELMEDLHDLESIHCSRRQRLDSLYRMQATHPILR